MTNNHLPVAMLMTTGLNNVVLLTLSLFKVANNIEQHGYKLNKSQQLRMWAGQQHCSILLLHNFWLCMKSGLQFQS